MTVASWIELSRSACERNVAAFRTVSGPARLGAVLKGNAYGHGLQESLPLVHPLVDIIDVITPGEASMIRRWEEREGRERRPVLVLGATDAADHLALAEMGADCVLGDGSAEASVAALRSRGLRLRVHVHLDTGLGREGFTAKALQRGGADFLRDAADVFDVVGVMSHFANTEDVTEQDYARTQLAAFDAGATLLRERIGLLTMPERHFAASAAALVLPEARLDAVRVGISLYGLWPSSETRLSARLVLGQLPTLEPALSWRCPSQVVKVLPAGSFVGYGCTWRCAEETRVAVLPVGYWDGYPRMASGKAHVLVRGRRCPVLGRVMMNHLIVDVTRAVRDDGPVIATLIGRDGDDVLPAELLAGWAQTIHYETLTRLGAHLRRVVVD